LAGYRRLDRIVVGFPDDIDPGPLNEIEPETERVTNSSIHVFQIVADNRAFRVFVEGIQVTIKEVTKGDR